MPTTNKRSTIIMIMTKETYYGGYKLQNEIETGPAPRKD